MDRSELLAQAVEYGIIKLSDIEAQVNMNKKEKILNEHHYWQGTNGKWHAYFPDGKGGRKLKTRNKESDIQNDIFEYYKVLQNNPTVSDVFNNWIETKHKKIKTNTIQRYERQFKQCFVEFGKRRIRSITENDIEEFVCNTIERCQLTHKGYEGFRTILYGIFKYAKKMKFIDFCVDDIVEEIDLYPNMFRKVYHEEDENIFMDDEIPLVIDKLMENLDITNLLILLEFATGIRNGEAVAIRQNCIKGDVIHIKATEISYNNGNGTYTYEVADWTKSEAGYRDVVVMEEFRWILYRIQLLNNPDDEFIFSRNGKRICTYNVRTRLRTICNQLGIKPKSPHKIRRTYLSNLIDKNVAESVIIAQSGHTTIDTTKKYYHKNHKRIDARREELKKASSY